jgi:hypothetical protein
MRFKSLFVFLLSLIVIFISTAASGEWRHDAHPVFILPHEIPGGLKEEGVGITSPAISEIHTLLRGGLTYNETHLTQDWIHTGQDMMKGKFRGYDIKGHVWIFGDEKDAKKNYNDYAKAFYEEKPPRVSKSYKYESHYRPPRNIGYGDEAWHKPFSYETWFNKRYKRPEGRGAGDVYLVRKGKAVFYVYGSTNTGGGQGELKGVENYKSDGVSGKVKTILTLYLSKYDKFARIEKKKEEAKKVVEKPKEVEEKRPVLKDDSGDKMIANLAKSITKTIPITLVKVLPQNKEPNVPFKGFIGQAVFSGSWTEKQRREFKLRFMLEYKDDKGEMVRLKKFKYSRKRRGNQVIFQFDAQTPLIDGIKYRAVLDWKTGKKVKKRQWVFSTAPELDVRIKLVQVLEGQDLVKDKDTVVRVWIDWKNQYPPVDPDWIIKESHMQVLVEQRDPKKVVGEWDSRKTERYPLVKGPVFGDQPLVPRRTYGKPWIDSSADSINFYTFKPKNRGKQSLMVTVMPVPQSFFSQIKYFKAENFKVRKQIRKFRYKFVAVKVGAWSFYDEAPYLADFIREQDAFFRAMFPLADIELVDTDPSNVSIFERGIERSSSESETILELGNYLEELNKEAKGQKLDRIVGIVPPGYMKPGKLGRSIPEGLFACKSWFGMATDNAVIVQAGAREIVTAHEIAHTYDLAKNTFGHLHSDGKYDANEIKGFDVYVGRKIQGQTAALYGYDLTPPIDFLVATPGNRRAWIAPKNYEKLLNILTE